MSLSSRGPWELAIERLRRDRAGISAASTILFIILIALFRRSFRQSRDTLQTLSFATAVFLHPESPLVQAARFHSEPMVPGAMS